MRKNGMYFLKTTLVGGFFFLIPLTVVVLLGDKLIQLASGVTNQLARALSLETAIGTVLLILFALW